MIVLFDKWKKITLFEVEVRLFPVLSYTLQTCSLSKSKTLPQPELVNFQLRTFKDLPENQEAKNLSQCFCNSYKLVFRDTTIIP